MKHFFDGFQFQFGIQVIEVFKDIEFFQRGKILRANNTSNYTSNRLISIKLLIYVLPFQTEIVILSNDKSFKLFCRICRSLLIPWISNIIGGKH